MAPNTHWGGYSEDRPVWHVTVDDKLIKADETAAFLQSFIGPEADLVWSGPYMRWKLGPSNPAGAGFLTVAVCDGQVVGCCSVTRKRLWFEDQIVDGGETGDTYTHPDFQRRGGTAEQHPTELRMEGYLNRSIFGRLVTETRTRAEAAGISIVYGTPNANSMPGYTKRLGFRTRAQIRNYNFIRPTARGIAGRAPILRPFRGGLSLADRIFSRLCCNAASSKAPGVRVENESISLDEIDELWHRARTGKIFIPVRDGSWFQHRFAHHPLANYDFWSLRRKGKLDGLIVTRLFHTMNGRQMCYFADWLVAGDGEQTDATLARGVAEIINRCEPDTVNGFLLWHNVIGPRQRHIRRLGFLRGDESPVIIAGPAEQSLFQNDVSDIAFTVASSDNV